MYHWSTVVLYRATQFLTNIKFVRITDRRDQMQSPAILATAALLLCASLLSLDCAVAAEANVAASCPCSVSSLPNRTKTRR